MGDGWNVDEAPEKSQKISSVCVGLGAADKKGEVSNGDYEACLKEMAEEYRACDEEGKFFVHIRERYSSNKAQTGTTYWKVATSWAGSSRT